MSEYSKLGHLKLISQNENDRICQHFYLPHHAVLEEDIPR